MALTHTQVLEEENQRLKNELSEMLRRNVEDKLQFEETLSKERTLLKAHSEQLTSKESELENTRNMMLRLTRQLDEEVTAKTSLEVKALQLECKINDAVDGEPKLDQSADRKTMATRRDPASIVANKTKDTGVDSEATVSMKLMRVIQQWMDAKDLQQAFLRNASINDVSYTTLNRILGDCRSLQMLDLAQNQLSMDSCSDICRVITVLPCLVVVSLAHNLFSLRSIGYFMTAVMERQNKKRLAPIEVLDLDGNEGFVAAMNASPPVALLKQVSDAVGTRLPPKGVELVANLMKALWKFLHFTEHPQVIGTIEDQVAFHVIDKTSIRKMETALTKIVIMTDDSGHDDGVPKTLHANLALLQLSDAAPYDVFAEASQSKPNEPAKTQSGFHAKSDNQSSQYQDEQRSQTAPAGKARPKRAPDSIGGTFGSSASTQNLSSTVKPFRVELRDPFNDLKATFEQPKEKLQTFNLKQIVTRNGTVLMNMLERMLETTEVDAKDVESDQTLLEYACRTGNMGLAKLCYRRGANLSARTKTGESYFNIVTKSKRYDFMEFLHTYGVRINHQDAEGKTALHVAAANDDVDAVCRLLEWGVDVNLYDHKKRTPLHVAARSGHTKTTMLLLEVGADLNAKDEKEYTAVAHSEAMNHFKLMDRLVQLGGKGHGLAKDNNQQAGDVVKKLGGLALSASVLKSSALGRIGKVAVKGLPPQLQGTFLGTK